MTNNLQIILKALQDLSYACHWVLGTVDTTEPQSVVCNPERPEEA